MALEDPTSPAHDQRDESIVRLNPEVGRIQKLVGQSNAASRYVVSDEVGRGGMGTILKAFDADLRRTLAMKVMRPEVGEQDPAFIGRFLEEAQVTGQLQHPGVVPVHELGADVSGRVYFTMRLVQGRDLAQVFKLVKTGKEGWTVTRALGVLLKVCEAMAYAHNKGVVHRDLKPANIMVGRYGEVYVMDWGLARVQGHTDRRDLRPRLEADAPASEVLTDRRDIAREHDDSPLLTMDGAIIGTPCYIPPEQAAGEMETIGPHSDIYSVGAMLYHVLTGSMPYASPGARASAYVVLAKVLEGPPKPVHALAPKVPAELEAICDKAMAREAEDRYPSMAALADDLRAYLEGRVVSAHKTGALIELRKWVGRNRGMAAALLAALLLLVAGVAGVGSVRARAARQLAAANETTARTERARAEASDRLARVERERALASEELARTERERAAASENLARAERDRAAVSERLVQAERERADENERRAKLKAIEERWQAYVAELGAVQMDLLTGSVVEARRRLGDCPEALRGWEWRHLDLAAALAPLVLQGHEGRVQAVACSPDGAHLVSGSSDGAVVVWDGATGRPVRTLPGASGVISGVAYGPEGRWIAACSSDGAVRVWNTDTGELRLKALQGDGVAATSLAASPDGRLASGGDDGTVRLWDVATSTSRALEGHGATVEALAFGPDDRLASASSDGTVRLWDTRAEELRQVVEEDPGPVFAVALSRDGKLLASGGRDKTIRVRNLVTGAVQATFEHDGQVLSLAFSSDGTRLVSGSDDRTVRVWDVAASTLRVTLEGHRDLVGAVAFSPDDKVVVSTSDDRTIRLWSGERGGATVSLRPRAGLVSAVGFTPDGARVLAASSDETLHAWDAITGEARPDVRPVNPTDSAVCAAVSPEGDRAAMGRLDSTTLVFDAETGATLHTLRGHEGAVLAVTFAPDGRLATGGADGTVRLWAKSGAPGPVLHGHTEPVSCLAFSADGRRLASGSEDRTAMLWDIRTATRLAVLEAHSEAVLALAFESKEDLLATGSRDRTVRLWDNKGGSRGVLRGHAGEITALAFSPDGTRLASASADRSVRIWSPEAKVSLATLRGHSDAVISVAFSPDGMRLVSGGRDEVVRLWETALARARQLRYVAAGQEEPGAVGDEPRRRIVAVVIVHPENPVTGVSFSELRAYLTLERQYWPNRKHVNVYLPPSGSDAYEILLDRVYRMSHKTLQKYWVRKLFNGDIPAKPSVVPTPGAAGLRVRAELGAISVVPAAEVPAGVKALKVDGKRPGDEGYPLDTGEMD